MDISTLKYFITVAKMQHMSRAAQQLNITQPSLSTSIRRLEAELGFQLFDRTGRGIQLNEYGEIFLQGAVSAENALSLALAEMEEKRSTSVAFIRLACSNSPTNSKLIDYLLSKGDHLKIDDIPQQWEQALLDNSCDLVITMGNLHAPHIEQMEVRTQKVVAVASKSHPLASAETVTLSDLHRYPFCSTDSSHSIINVIKERHPVYNFHPHITFLGRNSSDLLKAVRSGRCIGLMTMHNLTDMDDLTVLPVKDFNIELPIYLYWRGNDVSSRELTDVQKHIIDFYNQMSCQPASEKEV